MKRGKNDIPGFANWYREYLNHREFVEFMGVGADTELAICLHAAIYEENRGAVERGATPLFCVSVVRMGEESSKCGLPEKLSWHEGRRICGKARRNA